MDSIPRKRKLSEFGRNVTSPREQTFSKTPVAPEENDQRIRRRRRRLSSKSAATPEDSNANELLRGRQLDCVRTAGVSCQDSVLKENPPEVLEAIEEVCESDGEKPVGEEWIGDRKETEAESYSREVESIWYSTEYIEDIIAHEMQKESAYELSGDFCRKYDINPTGREILIDWLISVQVCVKADNSVLHLAVALLDILLDSEHVPLTGMQGAAIAAFWVAHKFIRGSISMKTLLGFCAGTVTKRMIKDNEILVLQTSRLIEAGGSLTVFFNYILYNIFGAKFPPVIYYCGLYLMEIMLLQFMFVDCSGCEKAAAAVFTALSVFGAANRFDHVTGSRFITKARLLQVYRRLMRSLKLMYHDKSSLKHSSVYMKYKSARYWRVSVHQNLKSLATA